MRTALPFRSPLVRAVTISALLLGLLLPAGPANAECGVEPEPGYRLVFDGTAESLAGWHQAGPGRFDVVDCTLMSVGGMGLLWYAAEELGSYALRAEWKITKTFDNSGIFVGFPDAGDDPWVAVNQGYEIQIDQYGRMDGHPRHITGAIYDIQGPNRDTRLDPRGWTDWNVYEITVDDPWIVVRLNGEVVNEFRSIDPARDLSQGYFGLQNHGNEDTTYFRNVQIKEIAPGTGAPLADVASQRNNVGVAHDPTSGADFDGGGFSYSAAALRLEGVTAGAPLSAGGMDFRWPAAASGQPDNVVAAGQVLDLNAPAGAQRLGLLAAADHGPATGTLGLTYDDGETVQQPLTVSDWTLNAGAASPSARNTIAVTTPVRMGDSTVPERVDTHVFAVAVDLDPTRRLVSLTLPTPKSGRLHVFDLAVQ